MEHLGADELRLNGILQVDTAIAALAAVEVNPKALAGLKTFRDVQKQLATMRPDEPETLNIYLQGGETAAWKADLLVGLELLSSSANTPEQKIAARALFETMTQTT